ncbi:MAG: DinB family protein [Egibacteraceae bacterium]
MAGQKADMGTTEYHQTRAAVEAVAGSIAEMLRGLPDTGVRIPNSDWSVGEAAAHLAVSQECYTEWLKGRSPYPDTHVTTFASVNAQSLEELSERDGAVLATLIVSRTRAFLEESASYPVQHQVHPHYGPMDLPSFTSLMLVHLLTHGWPMAKALGRPSPLEPAHTDLAIPCLQAVLPSVLNEAGQRQDACLEVRIRGGRRFAVVFDNGSVTVEDAPTKRVDCYLSADPVAFFLVACGLRSQWGLIAQGKLIAWGLKPWLALKFKSYFPNP